MVAIHREKPAYLVLFVDLFHAPLTFRLCDDLSGVLNNDLMWFKHSHCADTKATIWSVHDFDTIVIAVSLGTSLELSKRTVATYIGSQPTVCVVALICHDTVVAGFTTCILRVAVTLG
jgi:hypothetical protein